MATNYVSKLNGEGTAPESVFNAVRASMDEMMQGFIPVADGENWDVISSTFEKSPSLLNEYTRTMIDKVGFTTYNKFFVKNPLSRFKKSKLEIGRFVEEIYIGLLEPQDYDAQAGADAIFGLTIPEIKAAYHEINWRKYYRLSISRAETKRAFTSASAFETFLNTKVIKPLIDSHIKYEFLNIKSLIIAAYKSNKLKVKQMPDVNTEQGAKQFLKDLRKESNDMTFLNKNTIEGVEMATSKENQHIILDTDTDAAIDVMGLAQLFNIDKAEVDAQRIVVDKLDGNIKAMLTSDTFFQVYDAENATLSNENPASMFTNYFMHIWQVYSVSPFSNAVFYVKELPKEMLTIKQDYIVANIFNKPLITTAQIFNSVADGDVDLSNIKVKVDITNTDENVKVAIANGKELTDALSDDGTITFKVTADGKGVNGVALGKETTVKFTYTITDKSDGTIEGLEPIVIERTYGY